MVEAADEPLKVVILSRGDPLDGMRAALAASGLDVTVKADPPFTIFDTLEALSADILVAVNDAVVSPPEVAALREIRTLTPGVPFVVVHRQAASVTPPGVSMLVDVTLVAPTDEELVSTVASRALLGREARRRSRPAVVLAIGAHPDDVEIGVGGTLAAHARAGDEIAILTMSHGGRGGDADARAAEAAASAAVVGARLFLEDLVDTEMTSSGETVRRIERVVREVGPSIVYVHSVHDRHQDHRAVHEATRVAARPVPMIACYQSPSSTVEFAPNRFVEIDAVLDVKLRMLACFASQGRRDYMAPERVRITAEYWSRFGPGSMNEPLEVVRDNLRVGATGSPLVSQLAGEHEVPADELHD